MKTNSLVAKNLGFDIVEFRKGFLEDIPVEDKAVDLITSNCVINLSPDKKAVFNEMWRILKDHGRIVISDIVSEVETPLLSETKQTIMGRVHQRFINRRRIYGLSGTGRFLRTPDIVQSILERGGRLFILFRNIARIQV